MPRSPVTSSGSSPLLWANSRPALKAIEGAGNPRLVPVKQQFTPRHAGGSATVGIFNFDAGKRSAVTISNKGTTGHVIADAVQLVREED